MKVKMMKKICIFKYLKNLSFNDTPLFSTKELYDSNQIRNDQSVKYTNDALNE